MLKPFQEFCFNRTISLSLLAQIRYRARYTQMPEIMRCKLHALLFFELLLRMSKELIPVIVEGRAGIRFSSSGQKQGVVIGKIFQAFASVGIVFCSLRPNVVE